MAVVILDQANMGTPLQVRWGVEITRGFFVAEGCHQLFAGIPQFKAKPEYVNDRVPWTRNQKARWQEEGRFDVPGSRIVIQLLPAQLEMIDRTDPVARSVLRSRPQFPKELRNVVLQHRRFGRTLLRQLIDTEDLTTQQRQKLRDLWEARVELRGYEDPAPVVEADPDA